MDEFDQFLKLNFTGPSKLEKSTKKDLNDLIIDELVPNKHTQAAKHLVAAIQEIKDPLNLARALVIHQSLLDGPSETLKTRIFQLYSQVDSEQPGVALELARAHLIYNDLEETQEYLYKAQQQQQFTWAVTGVLGKRTQFQERDAAQLVALAESKNTASTSLEPNITNRPHNSQTLLEKPLFTGELPAEFRGSDANVPSALNNSDIALMLLQAEYLLRSNPAKDAAINSQVLAIAERIIFAPENTVDWLLYSRALWLRSCVESHFESRTLETMERGTLQMADIVNGLHKTDAETSANRLGYVHLVVPLPKWTIDIELAKRLVQIGGMQASAAIYERLEMPVDAAVCYAAAGESDKALAKLNVYLEENAQDGRAWSIKGDITQDPECWQKAWDLSHYLTAKVSLGKYYQAKGELDLAASHFKEAVAADSQILDIQFSLGCLEMQRREFANAERAFTQCIKIKPDESKCWSNLGAVFAQLGKLEQALHAFDRALQVDQNAEPNFRVWNNYMLLASELRKWQIVIDGYKYMIDGKFTQDRFINPSILTEMTVAFIGNDYSGSALDKSFVQLMCEKLPQKVAGDPNLWRLAAKINIWQNKPWEALKAYESGWQMVLEAPEDSLDAFRKLVTWTAMLSDAYTGLGSLEGRIQGSKVCPEGPLKARTCVQKALARGTAYKSTAEYEKLDSLLS